MSRTPRLVLLSMLVLAIAGSMAVSPAATAVRAQQPTGVIPTVTGTPEGPYIVVTYPEQINVRAGPNQAFYEKIGVLQTGETAPAIGRSPGGEWIQITYLGAPGGVGWVYAYYLELYQGSILPIVEPPPTATPLTTPTINPTYAAAFGSQLTPTRLPTFTAPPPLQYPTFEPVAGTNSRIPAGFIILGFLVVGVLGALISFVRGR